MSEILSQFKQPDNHEESRVRELGSQLISQISQSRLKDPEEISAFIYSLKIMDKLLDRYENQKI
jgi:hypothetical protein